MHVLVYASVLILLYKLSNIFTMRFRLGHLNSYKYMFNKLYMVLIADSTVF